MFLISTIIYFGDEPAGYDVFRENSSFYLKPAVDTHCPLNAPVIEASLVNGNWIISEVAIDVKDQVIKIIEVNSLFDLPQVLSVAS